MGSPDIPQLFLPTISKKGTYSPRLYGAATVQFRDRKRKVDQPRFVAFLVPLAYVIKVQCSVFLMLWMFYRVSVLDKARRPPCGAESVASGSLVNVKQI